MTTRRRISPAGLLAIRKFEGCVLRAYQDVGGVWTIGVGHTGPDVIKGLVWTQEQADAELASDVERFEIAVSTACKVPLTQGQFDSLVSLAFNIGAGAFMSSTLVRKLNAGDLAGAAAQFVVWNRAAGVFNPGLLSRRAAELWTFARSS
jgi:lysozyme